jgi:magnesium-transporting ATPase (P-type)
MSSTRVIDDGLVDKVNLLVPRYWLFRWDVLPFVVCYLALFQALYYADIYSTDYAKELANELEDPGLKLKVALAGIPVLLALQVLLFLISQWNMTLKCDLGYIRVNTVATASVVHVVAAKNMGKDRIVPVMMLRLPPSDPNRPAYANDPTNSNNNNNQTVSIAGSKHRCSAKFFEYQKVKYEFDETERNCFVRCESPAQGGVSAFLTHNGHEQEAAVMMCLQKWGINEFDIPVPPFLDLYMENLTAPFFVFQVLCLFLWSLDDYWYYSAFTLLMLMFFEGMLCKQRLDGLLMLRQMRRPSMPVQVYRGGKWGLMSSEGMVPGDVVALTTVKIEEEMRQAQAVQQGQPGVENDNAGGPSISDEIVLPCDALIVRGSCVVNEAMLTGESVPQIKETLSTCEDRDHGVVSIASGDGSALWKRHMVFGGTTLVQDAEIHSGDEQSPCDLPRPPFGGCIAVVVRTGFSTTQGGLMRKILFATERVNATSTETVHFIAVLVVFAMMASAVVLKHGLVDESRNKFKLVLHCVMIITSVVPPELPMELSLAVTNSLAALSRHLVFCTEPFRIPFAGKLDILCFDKTGTLTKDKMILRGVVAPHDISFCSDSNAGMSSSGGGSASTQPQLVPECAAILSSAGSSSSSSSDKERFAIMKLLGGGDDNSSSMKNKNGATDAILATMAMCNSLFINKGVIQGDPMEVETHRSSGFGSLILGGGSSANNNQTTRPDLGIQTNPQCQITVGRKHLYPFSSALKRMSVVVTIKKGDNAAVPGSDWVLTKGAPEVRILLYYCSSFFSCF